jgi:hypothetical protein
MPSIATLTTVFLSTSFYSKFASSRAQELVDEAVNAIYVVLGRTREHALRERYTWSPDVAAHRHGSSGCGREGFYTKLTRASTLTTQISLTGLFRKH